MPGQAKRRATREAAERRARFLAELEARRQAEQELAEREKHGQDRRATLPRVAVRATFRARRILAPFLLLAVLAGAAWGGTAAELPALAPAALWLAAALGVWVQRLRDQLHRDVERRYAATCVAAGAVWLGWAGLSGPGAVDSILVAGWAVLSVPWWAHHWPRPRVEPPTVVESVSIETLWAAHVADSGGPLPGARLFDPEITECGRSWRVQFVPGRQPLGMVVSRLPAIAQGVREPYERILLEQHPDTRDPSIGKFQVIERSPIESTVYFERPSWEEGWLHLGPHGDGMGEARWRHFTENSMWGGYLLGSLGSGKSRLMEVLALTARAMGHTVIVFIDGQDGASSSTLHDAATWSGGLAEAEAMLSAIEAGMRIRQKYNRVHRLSGFTPSAELPGVLVVVDECHKVFLSGPLAERWAAVAREGRKVGFAILAASQVSSLDVFGHSEALRSSLLAGNCIVMRTTSRMSGSLISGFDLNPADLPALPGYGYVVAAPGSGARTAPFRTRYLPDAKHATEHDVPVPTVEEWFAKTPDGVLDEMTARAFGPVFLDRHRLAEESARAAWDEIEGRTPAVSEPEREQVVVTKPSRTATADVILALLADRGPTARADLDTEVHRLHGTGPDAVQKALQGLLERGVVERLKRGVYALTGGGQAAA